MLDARHVIVTVAFTLSLLGTAVVIPAQVPLLDSLLGKDLWKLPYTEREQLSQTAFVGKLPSSFVYAPSPWHAWKTRRNGQERYVLLLGESMFGIPGGSSAAVLLFDPSGQRIRSWSFQTGWRINLVDATFEFSDDLACDLLTIQTARVINGRNIAREYFALKYDQLRLIRLEDDSGQAIQNEYIYPNYEIGLVPDARTSFQWTAMLESTDKTEVLSALTFLGGRHLPEEWRRIPDESKESRYAAIFQELIDN